MISVVVACTSSHTGYGDFPEHVWPEASPQTSQVESRWHGCKLTLTFNFTVENQIRLFL